MDSEEGTGRSTRNHADELKRTTADTAPEAGVDDLDEGTFHFEKPVFRDDDSTGRIIGAFYHVYREMGEGHLETVYRNAMALTMQKRGLRVQMEAPLEATFEDQVVGHFRADILVNERVVVELKAASAITPAHARQLTNYLKSSGLTIGFVFNFGPRPDFIRRIFTHKKEL